MTEIRKGNCSGLLLVFGLLGMAVAGPNRIELAGPWEVRLDPTPALEHPPAEGYQPVQLPGALRDSGLGNPVGPEARWIGTLRMAVWNRPEYQRYQQPDQFKVPFWLQPERHYVGLAYYRRNVEIPEAWRRQRITLFLERPHWRTTVWVDDAAVGSDDSLSTPHVYDLSKFLSPGKHTLTLGVNNSLRPLDVGLNSHSVSDHTQTAWHGIVGKLELQAEPLVGVEGLGVNPSADGKSVRVKLRLSNGSGRAADATVRLHAACEGEALGERSLRVAIPAEGASVDCTVALTSQAPRWDEFSPRLCQLTATLEPVGGEASTKTVAFGVRSIATRGTQFVLNGRPLFLRGTLECCIFPLTGYPPTDVQYWKKIVRVCKAHGLNHIRFHSWCPPEAAFVAADELGFYYQVECSTWPMFSTGLGVGKPIDNWLYREGERILAAYGNHPSFLLLAMGNEPGGPQRGAKYLGPWVDHFKAKTDQQLVTSGSGWPQIPANEFHVAPQPRIQAWGAGLNSRINARPPETVTDYRDFVGNYSVPVVSHEIGQWCVYPNFDEVKKYTGSLKPRNFEIFQTLLEDAGMADQARDFLMASGKLQAMCYKEEIESALRTPGFGGFQLLDLHDFPGQGTALVGVLDPFWDSKPYISPEEFSRFCGPTVPLARLSKRIFTSDEKLVADIDVSHFGPEPLTGATAHWTLSSMPGLAGELPSQDLPAGTLTRLGRIEAPLAGLKEATPLKLVVTVQCGDQQWANDWDVWVYPAQLQGPPPEDVLVVDSMSEDAVKQLADGGRVVLFARPTSVKTDVQMGFSSIFWNTAWTNNQPPHTLGILCNPRHAAFAEFPTEYHSNWQWWDPVTHGRTMVLDGLPEDVRPIVQVVPDWFKPQRLGLVFEAKVGAGKLLVCSIDLDSDLASRPVARQMRHSLLCYAASDAFHPQTNVGCEAIRSLFREVPAPKASRK